MDAVELSGIEYRIEAQRLTLFLRTIPKRLVRGQTYEWQCPICDGVVSGERSTYSGHLWAACADCGFNIAE